MGLSLKHLSQYADEGEDMLHRIVTGDESWVHHYQPETKRASMEWKHPSSPAAVQREVRMWLRQQPKDFYAAGIGTLIKRWDKCINVNGDYVEK
jgi:hypothetical protein